MGKGRRYLAVPLLLGVVAVGAACWLAAGATEPERVSVVIVPLGALDSRLISDAEFALNAAYNVQVEVAVGRKVPEKAFYKPRNRYRAEKIAEELQELSVDGKKVLGLTQVDISTTKGEHKDWGVIGLAFLDGQGCVVSDYRLRGKGSDDLYRKRWMKTVIHEVGHSLGLDHCTASDKCPMQEYEGSVRNTDGAEMTLCKSCGSQVKSAKEPKIA